MVIPDAPGRILVVGTGLIGTSVGLAARAAGVAVLLQDADPERAALAARAGAGDVVSRDAAGEPEVVVIAVPPSQTGRLALEFLAATTTAVVTHVSSVQTLPQAEVEASMPTTDRFVGGHPIAGRELSGPAYASTDLFRDRPWVVTPTSTSDPNAVAAVMGLARVCGARPVRLEAAAHDVLFAQLSHVPQLVASALAGTLTKLSGEQTALAGAGIRDTTRLADSDPQLWAEIVSANAAPVAAGLRTVTHDLARLADALEAVPDRGDQPAADAV